MLKPIIETVLSSQEYIMSFNYYRYFECRPMFGLFAPIHKVTRLTSGNVTNSMSASTPSPQSRTLMNTSLRMSRERSGSQDSVSSISSTASSVSRSRVRLGVNSLSSNQVHAALLVLSKVHLFFLLLFFLQGLSKTRVQLLKTLFID